MPIGSISLPVGRRASPTIGETAAALRRSLDSRVARWWLPAMPPAPTGKIDKLQRRLPYGSG